MEHTEKKRCERFCVSSFRKLYNGYINLGLVKPDGGEISTSEQAFLFKRACECSDQKSFCAESDRYSITYKVCVGKRSETQEFLRACAREMDDYDVAKNVYIVASGIDSDTNERTITLKKVEDGKFSKKEIHSIFLKAFTQSSFSKFTVHMESVVIRFRSDNDAKRFMNYVLKGESLDSDESTVKSTEGTKRKFLRNPFKKESFKVGK